MTTIYKCDYCGEVYDHAPECEKCETLHQQDRERLANCVRLYDFTGAPVPIDLTGELDFGDVKYIVVDHDPRTARILLERLYEEVMGWPFDYNGEIKEGDVIAYNDRDDVLENLTERVNGMKELLDTLTKPREEG